MPTHILLSTNQPYEIALELQNSQYREAARYVMNVAAFKLELYCFDCKLG